MPVKAIDVKNFSLSKLGKNKLIDDDIDYHHANGFNEAIDLQGSKSLRLDLEETEKVLIKAIDELRKNKLQIILKARQSGMVHTMTEYLAKALDSHLQEILIAE